MISTPRAPSSLGDVLRWAREATDWMASREPISSPDTLLSRTTKGTGRSANPAGEGGTSETSGLVWKGQFFPDEYPIGSIVIRKTIDELDTGSDAGTYIAGDDVSTNDIPPGEEATTASATPTIGEGGTVTGAENLDGGYGYLTAPTVTVLSSMGGSGATAHAVLGAGFVTEIVIDSPGSGYYSDGSTTFEFSAPTGVQKWEEFALGRWPKLTIAKVNQRIVLNSGREVNAEPYLAIYKDITDVDGNGDPVSQPLVIISLEDLASMDPPVPGGVIPKICLRQWSVCVDGVTKKAIFLSSQSWDLPA